ncbi:hypothetical protein C8J57DRAFT_1192183 [Mycena rebaudengoi]|nr:hypothetical protein C8J57DRAFT_1192183 [Mycena rebaudengoi]
MQLISVFALLITITFTRAALNGPCSSGGGVGICLTIASCKASGGTSTPGLCPGTPTNVQCCTKAPCSNSGAGERGVCRFASSCNTENHVILEGLCPGPSDFTCCVPCAPNYPRRL